MSPASEITSSLTIRLFGPMEILAGGEPLPPVRSRRILWLLALLVLRHGRNVEREWLAGTLWPEADQSQAFANLRPALSQLRSALGSNAERITSPNRHTLQLDLSGASVDLLDFDAAIAGKRPADLERAIALYRGPILEGCTEEWALQDREAREQDCLRALQSLAGYAAEEGSHEKAAAYWRRAITLDPLWEEARRGAIRTLAAGGNTNAALEAYREFVGALRSADPRATPDAETTELYQQLQTEIRRRAKASAGPREITDEAAAPKIHGALPHALTNLVGREDERQDVAAALRRSRLVTLLGTGGIGKTRLAVAVAEDIVREYPDGVSMVSLESLPALNDPGEAGWRPIVQRIASVLNIREKLGRALLPLILEHLRSKRLLIVLDNCEHVLEPCAQIVARLLRECPGLRILATSREALRVSGEIHWSVPALAAPDPKHLPTGRTALARALPGFDAVQLFLDRAQAAESRFVLNADNAPDVARLCSRLDGVPLAIELAAARVNVLSPAQILAQLDECPLDILTSRERDIAPRHRTLRATLEWSYQLLSPNTQAVLANLGVFRGGWTLEAARAVCPETDMLAMHSMLRDASLINLSVEPDGNSRYSMLETVREFAAELLGQSPQAEEIRHRHALFYRAWLDTFQNDMEPYYRLAPVEYPNLIAALMWAFQQEDDALLAHLGVSLSPYWSRLGDAAEGRYWLEAIMSRISWDKPAEQGDRNRQTIYTDLQEGLLLAQQWLYGSQNDRVAAAEICIRIFAGYQAAGHPVSGRTMLFNASTFSMGFDFKRSLQIMEQCLPLEQEASPTGRANALLYSQMAYIAHATGQAERSAALLAMAHSVCQNAKGELDKRGYAQTMLVSARIALCQGDVTTAERDFQTCLEHIEQNKDPYMKINALCGLMATAQVSGDMLRQESLMNQILPLFGSESSLPIQVQAVRQHSELLWQKNNRREAKALVREGLSLFTRKSVSNRMLIHAPILLLAEISLEDDTDSRRCERAAYLLGAALGIANRLGLVVPDLRDRQRAQRLRDALATHIGVKRYEEAITAWMHVDDETALDYALSER